MPTMAAATGLELMKHGASFTSQELGVLGVGFIGALITALVAVKYFVTYVKHHSLVGFGVYRIVVAIGYWLMVR